MDQLTDEEKKKILESSPRGTWAILAIYAVLFVAGWLYFWFGLYIPRGLTH
ncbi:hypothetical protein [Thiomicrorhabdus sp. Milos-T2]|uniref:hypothetical protein n=1 Tax=Thiomicrorhabdus sp. Milos-T2 TaxID=90814 RepID=UPI000493ED94|nr:hypothetical protein [Thiomicrorhabdus sp. Milos-T2]